MPRRDDDEFALAAERDRVAAGLEDYAPDDVPPRQALRRQGFRSSRFGGARVVGRHLNDTPDADSAVLQFRHGNGVHLRGWVVATAGPRFGVLSVGACPLSERFVTFVADVVTEVAASGQPDHRDQPGRHQLPDLDPHRLGGRPTHVKS